MIDRRTLIANAGIAGLLGWVQSGRAQGGTPPSGAATVSDLRELAALPPSRIAVIHEGRTFLWLAGNAVAVSADTTVVAHEGTPLSAGAWVLHTGPLSVRTFGAIAGPRGVPAANTAAFAHAIAAASLLRVPLHLEGGAYELDASGAPGGGVNFAREWLHVNGGGATLNFRGRGRAFVLDQGGAPGLVIEGMSVSDITIAGEAGVVDGFYMRGVVRSVFRNITVRDVSGKAFWLRHAVSCQFDSLTYSPLRTGEVVPRISATHGLFIDSNDTPGTQRSGYYSADCVFTNAVMEGFPGIGCHIADGSGHVFVGGTFEACRIGLSIGRDAPDNVFFKVWMEANSEADAVIEGDSTGFLAPKFMSSQQNGPNVRIAAGANGTWFAGGGYIRHVDMAAGSIGTSFHHIGVDQNLSGTIGFQGTGSYTRIGCRRIGPDNNVVGNYDDIFGAVDAIGTEGAWMPTLVSARGTVAVTSATGSYQKIGGLMFVQCTLTIGSAVDWRGGLSVGGLPYPAAAQCAGAIHVAGMNDAWQVQIEPLAKRLSLSAGVSAARTIASGTTITISITYAVAR